MQYAVLASFANSKRNDSLLARPADMTSTIDVHSTSTIEQDSAQEATRGREVLLLIVPPLPWRRGLRHSHRSRWWRLTVPRGQPDSTQRWYTTLTPRYCRPERFLELHVRAQTPIGRDPPRACVAGLPPTRHVAIGVSVSPRFFASW